MKLYKVVTYIPVKDVNKIMEELNKVIEFPFSGKYDYVFTQIKVLGSFRPLEGANPHIGKVGEIEYVEEIKLETTVKEKNLKNVLITLKNIHPYEEPVIDVYEIKTYQEFI